MRILQLNLNHCEVAQDLLYQTVREQPIEVAILCEQYKNLDDNSWVSDVSGKGAIWACNSQAEQTRRSQRAERSSIIDLTFVSGRMHRNATWKVCRFYINSDHQGILITLHTPTRKKSCRWRANGWNTKTFDDASFTLMLEDECELKGSAEEKARILTSFISGACDAAMTRSKPAKDPFSVYWWTNTIDDLSRCCNQARRRYQRARRLPEFSVLQEEFKRG
ncbi:uncharacterized protein [Halyomorpha halys]|uniref:uncharacterized protein n=1 Tax=Halyomorpha halys TaxID=286706 RepID=UPI0034D2B286